MLARSGIPCPAELSAVRETSLPADDKHKGASLARIFWLTVLHPENCTMVGFLGKLRQSTSG